MITGKTVFVTENEYKAIQQWEDDGGAPIEIVYLIMQDDEFGQHSRHRLQSPNRCGSSKSSANQLETS